MFLLVEIGLKSIKSLSRSVVLLHVCCIMYCEMSGITVTDAAWLPVFVRGECHNLSPVADSLPRYDETLGTVVHQVTCSFGWFNSIVAGVMWIMYYCITLYRCSGKSSLTDNFSF